jgi:hypothetical protein
MREESERTLMPEDPPFSATDENQAPFVPSTQAPVIYHCPNTSCDGHYYLAARDLGQEVKCSKCGLTVTIGKRSVSSLLPYVVLLIIGALVGFLIALRFK